jgi:hypothetical protein
VAAQLIVELLGKADSAISALKKTSSASQEATGAASNTGKTLAGIAGAVATGMAVKKVVDFGRSTVEAAGAAAKANKQLTAVFADTGAGAAEATKHATELADSLGRQIGVSPNVVKAGESILATFHSVSGEVGMQAGIFDRATKAGADLAAAGFGSISSNAVQLGKALEDPTKGLTALARSGVTFTQSQKDQIAAMQKSGDLLGAQKVVLAAVESQVKGTAEATAGSGAKMSVAYEEMKVKIGTALLPAVSKLKGEFAGLFDFISANSSWLVPLISGVAILAGTLVTLVMGVKMFVGVMEAVKLAIAGVKVAWALLNASFLVSPLGLIIIGIVALVAALVILYMKVDWFRAGVDAAFSAIAAVVSGAINGIVAAFNWLIGMLARYGQLILLVVMGPWFLVFKLVLAAINGGWSGVVNQISAWISLLAGIMTRVVSIISGPFIAAWNIVYSAAIAPLINAWNGVVGAVGSAIAGVYGVIVGPFERAVEFVKGLIGGLKGAWNAVANTINGVSISSPSVEIAGHEIVPSFTWRPPFHVPTLQAGGLLTRTGLVYAHAGEVISPAPARARGGPLVEIVNAHFSEKIDVATFGRRLAWEVETAGV